MKNKKKPASRILFTNLTYRDLKKECVSRGMDFQEIVESDVPTLHNWLHHNMGNKINTQLIDDYDDWIENELKTFGKDYLIHSSLRLGYIGERANGDVEKKPKEKVEKLPKKPKEKTEEGVIKGTKKAYTFELAKKGRTLEFITKRVLKRYPDASEKSIKIWFRTAKKTI